jgi:hypothetical protein
MAKRQSKNKPITPQSINVSQTVNVGQTWDSTAFAKLLQEQARSNETAIKNLEVAMASAGANQEQLAQQIAQSSMMKDIKTILLAEMNDKKFQQLKQDAVKKKEQEAAAIKKSNDELQQSILLRREEAKAISNIAKNMETFRTIGDRFSDMSKKLNDNFGSLSALKVTALKAFNIGGIFNKSIAKEKFIQTQRKLGSEDDRDTLMGKFESANKTAKQIKKNEEELSQFKKETGLSETELARTKRGKELLSNREMLAQEYSKSDLKASLVKQDGGSKEEVIEQQRTQEKQSDLLLKIEENTRGQQADSTKIKPADDNAGGGLLGNMMGGGGMGKALSSLKQFGVGIILVSAGLFVASKAFKSFAEVEWEDVGKGILALGALTVAALALDKVKGSMIGSAVGIGALSLATFGIAKALKEFSELDWGTIGKGFLAVAGLGAIGVVLGSFVGPALLGAAALAALGGGLLIVGEAMQSVGEGFDKMNEGLLKLAGIDGQNLLTVAAGVAALGPAMALFAAGNVASGLSNLVNGLLSAVTGQKSPVEQLMEIGKAGEGISKAGTGMQTLGEAMRAFAGIKKDDLKAIDAFPWEKATKFVAAGGVMTVNGNQVIVGSKANADQAASAEAKPSSGGTTVVAPSNTTVNRQTQVVSLPVRNPEQTMSRYLRSRYA